MNQPPPVCQWCGHPITGRVTWWDNRPQCANHIRCTRRIPKTTAEEPADA